MREVRALSALNDSKQHDPEAREALYPVVLRTAVKTAVISRCVRGIDARGLHRTNLAALRDALQRVARPGCLCLVGRLRRPRLRPRAARDRRRRRHERGDRGRVDPGQGQPRQLHASGRRAPSRLGVPLARRVLHARAPRRHPAPGRLAAAPDVVPEHGVPAARPLSQASALAAQEPSQRPAVTGHQNAASRWSRRTSAPRASTTTPIASNRTAGRVRPVGDLGQERRPHRPHLALLGRMERLPRLAPRTVRAARLDLAEHERRRRRPRSGPARRSACGGCGRPPRSPVARGAPARGPRRGDRARVGGRLTSGPTLGELACRRTRVRARFAAAAVSRTSVLTRRRNTGHRAAAPPHIRRSSCPEPSHRPA